LNFFFTIDIKLCDDGKPRWKLEGEKYKLEKKIISNKYTIFIYPSKFNDNIDYINY